MSELIIKAMIVRQAPSKSLRRIKITDSARCIFHYGNERLSVLIYDIDGGEAKVNKEALCEIAFMTGDAIATTISEGDQFELALANEVIAKGSVTEVLSRPA